MIIHDADLFRAAWRKSSYSGTDYDALSYEVIDCPSAVVDRARAFLSAAGLHYGAFGGPARFPGSHGFPGGGQFYAGLIGP